MVALEESFIQNAPLPYIALFDELYQLANRNIDFKNFKDRVIEVRRVAKSQSSGRKMSFRVIVATGNGQGIVGVGMGKSGLVREAVRKGVVNA